MGKSLVSCFFSETQCITVYTDALVADADAVGGVGGVVSERVDEMKNGSA